MQKQLAQYSSILHHCDRRLGAEYPWNHGVSDADSGSTDNLVGQINVQERRERLLIKLLLQFRSGSFDLLLGTLQAFKFCLKELHTVKDRGLFFLCIFLRPAERLLQLLDPQIEFRHGIILVICGFGAASGLFFIDCLNSDIGASRFVNSRGFYLSFRVPKGCAAVLEVEGALWILRNGLANLVEGCRFKQSVSELPFDLVKIQITTWRFSFVAFS
ncbi:hypothetical protein N7528_000838 [Penicillium herquei]|nr:hypothetical protein N7528_000838 [Penicillium herquei]